MKWADLTWLLVGVVLNSGAQLGLKAATQVTGAIDNNVQAVWISAQRIVAVPVFWVALMAYGLSVCVWIVGLSRIPVSQAYPVLSLGYVLAALLAWPLLGEGVSAQRTLGTFLIMVGVWVVARS
ncbi:MAG: EamA family transporter [Pseudomonadota bacterium]